MHQLHRLLNFMLPIQIFKQIGGGAPPPPSNALLLEDGTNLLLEDGTDLLLDP